jgi:hypothetical protein
LRGVKNKKQISSQDFYDCEKNLAKKVRNSLKFSNTLPNKESQGQLLSGSEAATRPKI